MNALAKRLSRLEDRLRPVLDAMREPVGNDTFSPVDWFTQKLDEWGIVRGTNESLAEATARALGWTSAQLRADLQRRAYSVKNAGDKK
jgi:hypothetical protein